MGLGGNTLYCCTGQIVDRHELFDSLPRSLAFNNSLLRLLRGRDSFKLVVPFTTEITASLVIAELLGSYLLLTSRLTEYGSSAMLIMHV